jgi:hypothetical protein
MIIVQGGSNMTGTDCGLFTHKSVPVIFESPCILLLNKFPKSEGSLKASVGALNILLYLIGELVN